MRNTVRDAILKEPVFASLPRDEKEYLLEIGTKLKLSFQYLRQLTEASADLYMWDEGPLKALLDPVIAEETSSLPSGTQLNARVMKRLNAAMDAKRNLEIDYTRFIPERPRTSRHVFIDSGGEDTKLLGTCPVAGGDTRCCNLLTLDAVRQCGYKCSYCSIQSFYDEEHIYFYPDLRRRLERLSAELHPDTIYHIGTGQASDSLMFGNRQGLLDDLCWFAGKHPRVILELKTKSDAVSYFTSRKHQPPKNLICTWSLNTPTVIDKEEHLTASLEGRIRAARILADRGILVGFHIHPMVWYRNWKTEYQRLITLIQETFSPREVLMISLGTLTFIRPVIQRLRAHAQKSKVLRIPLTEVSGKYSYPAEIKERLFSYAYQCFSNQWKEQVFFYLCMEPHEIWKPVFGFAYPSNEYFEQAMKEAYMQKIRAAGAETY